MQKNLIVGYIFAITVVVIWAMTFVSSKVLLEDFTPIEVLFDRFVIATLALLILRPKALKFTSFKGELFCALSGLFGITLYFVAENTALTLSNASNVSLIVSTAPIFVAIGALIRNRKQKLGFNLILGFILAMIGIACISFSSLKLELNPLGDLIALSCAIVWALYSLCVDKATNMGIKTLDLTIKTFLYATFLTVPLMGIYGYEIKFEALLKPINICNYLFLSLLASAFSFILWTKANHFLGIVKTNICLYAVPAVTAVGAVLIIDEKLTIFNFIGMVLAIAGTVISQYKTTLR
ncbi:MAG: DMT family transporter [Succinatimonas sp.]|jgi:drug/metabolite transporter (DMT)-like permease|nr:DMT family transporter [Succinatimonas sp.]MDY5722262.1 DMT family transporter [Succinivibrio sp.]